MVEVVVPAATTAAAANQVDATVTRSISVSQANDDQDNDGIPDITEGFGDVNTNGIPDFLDSNPPTGEEEQPQPSQPRNLLLPSPVPLVRRSLRPHRFCSIAPADGVSVGRRLFCADASPSACQGFSESRFSLICSEWVPAFAGMTACAYTRECVMPA